MITISMHGWLHTIIRCAIFIISVAIVLVPSSLCDALQITDLMFPSGGLPTAGGSSLITVTGTGLSSATLSFGPSPTSLTFTSLSCTPPTSSFGSMTCNSPAGTGFSSSCFAKLVLTDMSSSSDPYNCGSYTFLAPVIDSLNNNDALATRGGNVITVYGRFFGPEHTTAISATYGPTGTEYVASGCTLVDPQTTVTCNVGVGGGMNYMFQLTVSGLLSAVYSDQRLDFASPTIRSITPQTGIPTAGCSLCLTINGTNFLPQAAGEAGFMQRASVANAGGTGVRLTDIECAIGSDTITYCNAPAAVGTGYQFAFRVGATANFGDPEKSIFIRQSTMVPNPLLAQTYNYSQPTVSSVYPTGVNNVGNTSLTITGTQFGAPDTTVTNAMLYTAGGSRYRLTSCKVMSANTVITCVAPPVAPSLATGFQLSFSIGGQPVVSNITLTYPTFDAVDTDTPHQLTMLTNGKSTITIYGSNFGGVSGQATPWARLFNQATGVSYPMTCHINPSLGATCDSPVGIGTNYQLQVMLPGGNNVTSSTSQVVSYIAPTITGVSSFMGSSPALLPGGQILTIKGANYGNGPVSYAYLVNGTNVDGRWYVLTCSVQPWQELSQIEPTTIMCVMPPGGGTNHQVYLIIGGQGVFSNETTGRVSYTGPGSITNVTVGNDGSLSLTGTNFGDPASVVLKRGQDMAGMNIDLGTCQALSLTTITCTTVGAGTNWQLSLTIGGQTIVTNAGPNYPPPVIQSLNKATTQAAGDLITIIGNYFGNAALQQAYSGVINATLVNGANVGTLEFGMNCTIVTSIVIQCTIPYGVGTSHKISLWIAGQHAPIMTAAGLTISYGVPIITSVTTVSPTAMLTDGGVTITVTGSNMGSPAIQSLSPTICTGTLVNGYGVNNAIFVMPSCTLHTPTEMWCTLAAGVGYLHHVVITCAGQSSQQSGDALSFAAPIMTTVTPTQDSTLPTAGSGGTWTITGDNFGAPSLSSLSRLRLINGKNIGVSGFSLQGSCVIQSSTNIVCDIPAGVGAGYTLELTIGGQGVDSSTLDGHPIWSYDSPTITGLSTSTVTLSTFGGDVVTITGTNFGPASFTNITGLVTAKFVNGQGTTNGAYDLLMTSCSIRSQTEIWCVGPAGVGYDHMVLLTVAGSQVMSASFMISYTPPMISALTPNYGSRLVSTTVTVTATNVGIPGSIWIDGTVELPFYNYRSDGITGVIPLLGSSSTAASSAITITVGGQSSLLNGGVALPFAYYDFDPLSILIPVRGGWAVTVTGKGFTSAMDYNLPFMVEVSPSIAYLAAEYVSSTRLTFEAPMASGDRLQTGEIVPVSASLNGVTQPFVAVGNITFYAEPIITGMAPLEGLITGGTVLNITGVFPPTGMIFGQVSSSGACACVRDSLTPTTVIYCTTAAQASPSVGDTISVSVDVNTADRVFTAATTLHYQAYSPPSLRILYPSLLARTSNRNITVELDIYGNNLAPPTSATASQFRMRIGDGPNAPVVTTIVPQAVIVSHIDAAVLQSLSPGDYSIAVSYNGQQYTSSADNNAYLTVYDQPRLTVITPIAAVSRQGGDVLTVHGTGFLNTTTYQLQWYLMAQSATTEQMQQSATYVSATELHFTTNYAPYATSDGLTYRIIVAANSLQFTSVIDNYAPLLVYDRPTITSVTPVSGALRGATNVTLIGLFADTGYVRGQFGSQASPSCMFHSTTRVTCITPSSVTGAGSVTISVSVDYPNVDTSRYYWSTSGVLFRYTNESIAFVTPTMVLAGIAPTTDSVNGNVQMDVMLKQPILGLKPSAAMIRLVNGTQTTASDDMVTLDYATNAHGFQYVHDVTLTAPSGSVGSPSFFSTTQWTLFKYVMDSITMHALGRLRDDCSDFRMMIRRELVNLTVPTTVGIDTGNEWIDVPFVIIGCQTLPSTTVWYTLPPLTSIAAQATMVTFRMLYGDSLMTPANVAHYTASYASRVWDVSEDFKTMNPSEWVYQTDDRTITSFFNATHGLVYQSDTSQSKYPTSRTDLVESASFLLILTGDRWLDNDTPVDLTHDATDYVQPYIEISQVGSGEGNSIPQISVPSGADGTLFVMSAQPVASCSRTSITRRWWLMVNVTNEGMTVTSDHDCTAVNIGMATEPYLISFGIHQSITGRRSSIDGFYLKEFGKATTFAYDQVTSSSSIIRSAVTIISAMLPYQLVARANVVVQLSLNGQDWPLSYDVSTNNDVTHQLVTIDIIDSSIMDHIIDITPAAAPFDSVIAGSITFDSTVTSSSVFNKSSVALRLSSLDQFMTLSSSVASSSGNNVYNWSFDGSIPSSYNMDNILGTHPLQLQLTRSNDQQIMTGSSSSSSSFTKTARPPCGLCATTAQQVFSNLLLSDSVDVSQLVPSTEPLLSTLTLDMVQLSHLWWTTLESNLVSSSCGSPRLGHGVSWLWGPGSTVRALQSHLLDLRLAPAVLSIVMRFGMVDEVSPVCGSHLPIPGDQLTSAAVTIEWSNTQGSLVRTVASITPTSDNEWHTYNITLPSWTQSDGLSTILRVFQVPQLASTVMAIQDIGVYTYAPTQPSFIVTSFSPSTHISAAGGVVITITGSGFSNIGRTAASDEKITGAIMCSFGGRPAMNVIRVSDTMALCTTPSIAWTDATLTYETTFDVCGATFVGITNAHKTISFIGCDIGTYSSYNDGSCVLCALGSYSNTINTIDACHLCVAGRFGNVLGETSPLCTDLCFEGYYCPEGSSSGTQESCPIHSTSPRGSSSLSDCVCEDGYSLSVTGAECSSCSSLIGFSSDDGYATCSGIRMTWATLHDISGDMAATSSNVTGRAVLTSLLNNIVQFNISGNIRVIHASSSSGGTTRRLLAGDEREITNVNANDDSVAIMVRFGHSATLSSQQSVATNNNTAIFTSLSICDSIISRVDYLSWTTMVSCSLPYGISNNLSFSLWQYNIDGSVPILISYDGQVIVSGKRVADTFAYPAPSITAGTIRKSTLPLSTRSTSLLASSTTLSESIAFEGQFFDPTSMIVRYGVKGNTYACTIDIAQTTSTMVVCNTPANLISVTNDPLIFSIQQGGYMVYGKDTYRYPLVPIITRIWGCDGTSFSPLSTTTMGCPTFGNITITMCGSNWENTNLQAFVNGVECTHAYAFNATIDPSEVVNNSSQSITVLCPILLTCILPVGAGADQGVTVSSKGQFSPAAKLVSYSPPVITRVIGCPNGDGTNCNRFGGDRLTIIGNNFGPASPSVLIGSASCTNLQWTNHSYVTCDIPSGSGNDRSVILLQVNGDISSSSAATISYQPCDGGKQPDGLNCTSCSPGYYSSSGVECIACGPGRYAPNMSMDDCVSVPEGTFQGGYGQSVAIVCDDGESAPSPGLSQCLSCSAGKWSYGNDSASKVNCLPCDVGTYSDGTRPCEPCPELTFATTPGSQSRSKCSGSTYLLMHSPSHIDCLPCPSGVLCQDGIIQSNTQYYLAPQNDGSYRSLVCLPGLCRACNNSNVKAQLTNCCGDGRIQTNNPMCALCEDGLIEVGDGTKCQKCDASSGGLVFLFLFVTFVFLFIFHRTSQSSGKTSDAQQLLYFIQMLIIFFGPESGWISWLSFINLNMLAAGGSSCVVPLSPLGRLLSGIVIPAVGLAELAFVFLLDFGLWTWWKKKLRGYDHKYISWLLPKTRTFKSSPIRRTLVVYYLISYTSIATAVLQYFTCLTVSETKSVLQAYPAVSCQDDSYKSVNGFMWFICITFVVISPLVMLGALIWNHIKGRLSQVKHTQRYGPLYEHFRPSRYWWSFVTIVRRVILITLVSQLGYDRPLMFSWVTFTNILMLLIHMIALPYESVAGNNIETGLLTLHAIVTTLMTTLPFPLNSKQAAGISVLVFVPTIIFILYMIQTRTHHIIRERLSRISRYSRGSRTSSKRFSSSTAAAIQHEQQHKHVELPSPLPSLASSSSSLPSTGAVTLEVQNDDGSAVATAVV